MVTGEPESSGGLKEQEHQRRKTCHFQTAYPYLQRNRDLSPHTCPSTLRQFWSLEIELIHAKHSIIDAPQ